MGEERRATEFQTSRAKSKMNGLGIQSSQMGGSSEWDTLLLVKFALFLLSAAKVDNREECHAREN
jgi:hypothetical protein